MALIGYFLNNKLLTKWFRIFFCREMNQPCQFLDFFDGHDIWYQSQFSVPIKKKYGIIGCLFVIASDPSYIDKIHLQALPWCGGSLFCFPLHFHSGRRCPQPEKGLNQSLLKGERNLVIKIFWIHVRNRRRDSI